MARFLLSTQPVTGHMLPAVPLREDWSNVATTYAGTLLQSSRAKLRRLTRSLNLIAPPTISTTATSMPTFQSAARSQD